eukprot:TRINITY_DN35764_c0_g1_i1.p1 TRINITY_DN35764_c0_g1~~TRINITY_DN35764_c0_g1_i1.p1  ORF type:complete len:1238 (+),score=329.38 TRINITY_DN35764_c0_g1_i1:57-3770(+)
MDDVPMASPRTPAEEFPNGELEEDPEEFLDFYTTEERPLHTRYRKKRTISPSPVSPPPSDFLLRLLQGGGGERPAGLGHTATPSTTRGTTQTPSRAPSSARFAQPSAVSAAVPETEGSLPDALDEARMEGAEENRDTQEGGETRYSDAAEEAYSAFAELLALTLKGKLSVADLARTYKATCTRLSEALREEGRRGGERDAAVEHVLRHKASMLYGEAGTWALLWHLLGKADASVEDGHAEIRLVPSPSLQDACEFVQQNALAQRCLRIVQWLEERASLELQAQLQNAGAYVGSYSKQSGNMQRTQKMIQDRWKQQQRAGKAVVPANQLLSSSSSQAGGEYASALRHVDPDAPLREGCPLHEEDERKEGGLLADVWRLLQAGRLAEARQLCRSAGQTWRAASLGGCGDDGSSPASIGEWIRDGRGQEAQALEMDTERGRLRRLWKWAMFCASERIAETRGVGARSRLHEAAVYAALCSNVRRMLPACTSWEGACWAFFRSWLDSQVDRHLALLHAGAGSTERLALPLPADQYRSDPVRAAHLAASAPNGWPHAVLPQQPADMEALFQGLRTSELLSEHIRQSCKDPMRLVQMRLMLQDVGGLLELLKSTWLLDIQGNATSRGGPPPANRPSGQQPHMIRFAAHVVLQLRLFLQEEAQAELRLKHLGDIIIYTYTLLLVAQRREELVALYAAQLAPYLREDFYLLLMLELRPNASLETKRRILTSTLHYLPTHGEGSIMAIFHKVVNTSRQLQTLQPPSSADQEEGLREEERSSLLPAKRHRQQHVAALQWLALAPEVAAVAAIEAGVAGDASGESQSAVETWMELSRRALLDSNVTLREFALSEVDASTPSHVEALDLLRVLQGVAEGAVGEEERRGDGGAVQELRDNIEEMQTWRKYFYCSAYFQHWQEAAAAAAIDVAREGGDAGEGESRAVSRAGRALTAAEAFLQDDSVKHLLMEDEGRSEQKQSGDGLDVRWLFLRVRGRLVVGEGERPSFSTALVDPSGLASGPPDLHSACIFLKAAMREAMPSLQVQRALQLQLDVRISPEDGTLLEVSLRSLAGPRGAEAGGDVAADQDAAQILAYVASVAVKGVPLGLKRVSLAVVQAEGFMLRQSSAAEPPLVPDDVPLPSPSLVRELCRQCCLPHLVLQAAEVRAYLARRGALSADDGSALCRLVADPTTRLHRFFAPHQLQTMLLLERDVMMAQMAQGESALQLSIEATPGTRRPGEQQQIDAEET